MKTLHYSFQLIVLLGFGLLALTMFRSFQQRNKLAQAYLQVAIFTPTTHSALEEIEQGFRETLQDGSYHFRTFNAQGNKSLLRAQAEEIIASDFDLIMTIGATCSQTVAELLNKKELCTPHVFTGVDGPDFAHELMLLNKSSAGVYVTNDYKKQFLMLQKLKPETKVMLLVYDPAHVGLEEDKVELMTLCEELKITLRCIEVYQASEIQQKVVGLLTQDVDVLLVLNDNTVVSGLDSLVTLCNRYGITLFASDLVSGRRGAALAYGVTEYESGRVAAEQAQQILFQKEDAEPVQLRAITDFSFEINEETSEAQNFKMDFVRAKSLIAEALQ